MATKYAVDYFVVEIIQNNPPMYAGCSFWTFHDVINALLKLKTLIQQGRSTQQSTVWGFCHQIRWKIWQAVADAMSTHQYMLTNVARQLLNVLVDNN